MAEEQPDRVVSFVHYRPTRPQMTRVTGRPDSIPESIPMPVLRTNEGPAEMYDPDGKPIDYMKDFERKPKLPLGVRLKAHFRKFWWIHVIIFIACFLIVLFPLLFVAFPRLAQRHINDSSLEIQSMILSNPTPNSFHLEQTAVISNNASYHPRLDAFNASLSLQGTGQQRNQQTYAYRNFGQIEIPAVHAAKSAKVYVNQTVQITDQDALNAYTQHVLGSEVFNMSVKGHTKLHEMAFPVTTVNYNKTMLMKGFNKLYGFEVIDFTILLAPLSDGTNMLGTVYIPNTSVMTLSMGNVTFDNYISRTNTPIGNTTLTNLVLRPGNNTVPMTAIIDQETVIDEIKNNYEDGILPVDIEAQSVVYDGLHIGYFESAIRGVYLNATLDVGAALMKAGVNISAIIGG